MSIFLKQKQAQDALAAAQKALEETQAKIEESLKGVKVYAFDELMRLAVDNPSLATALKQALMAQKEKARAKDIKDACDYLIESIKPTQPDF